MQNLKNTIELVKDLTFKPKETWADIKGREMTAGAIMRDYLIILAALPAIAQFFGRWIIGVSIPFGGGMVKLSFFASLVSALIGYVLTVAGIWAFAKILQFLAPKFDSSNDETMALKIAVFSASPYLIAGIVGIIPALGVIAFLVGIYCLYLIYVGLPIVMDTPKEKSLPFTVVSIIAVILIAIIIGAITTPILNAFGPDINLRGF
jgi:hypothetical protein